MIIIFCLYIFTYSYIIQIIFKQIYLTYRWKPDILSLQVDLGVIAVKGITTLPRCSELKPHHQMHFSVIPRTSLSWDILPLYRGYSQSIQSPVDWENWLKSGVKWNKQRVSTSSIILWYFLIFFYFYFYISTVWFSPELSSYESFSEGTAVLFIYFFSSMPIG